MKRIIFIVIGVLISVTYGLDYCDKSSNEDDTCGTNGKCKTQICIDVTSTVATTTTAGGPKVTAPTVPTTTPTTTTITTTPPPSGRKRRGTTGQCSKTCGTGKECRYKCTGESGSIKHGLSPMVLLVGVLTKLFLVG